MSAAYISAGNLQTILAIFKQTDKTRSYAVFKKTKLTQISYVHTTNSGIHRPVITSIHISYLRVDYFEPKKISYSIWEIVNVRI